MGPNCCPPFVVSAICCIIAEKTSLRTSHRGPGSWLTGEKQSILEHMIRNVCTLLKLHLVTSIQISVLSRRPQHTWDCVPDFEVDRTFVAWALSTYIFFKWIRKFKKIRRKSLTGDWSLLSQFWSHILGQCINLEVLYTYQHATTIGSSFDTFWTCISIVSVEGFTETKMVVFGVKDTFRCWEPVVNTSVNYYP